MVDPSTEHAGPVTGARRTCRTGSTFTDPAIYAERIPAEEFAELRRTAPVWWNEQSPEVGGFHDDGFWVVTKHADVKEVSRRSDVFSTWENTAIPRFNDDIQREQIELQRFVLLNKDAPEHTKLRKLIAKRLHPARDQRSARRTRRPVPKASSSERSRPAAATSSPQVACELPLQAIAELIGVPQEDRRRSSTGPTTMTSYDDPDSTRRSGRRVDGDPRLRLPDGRGSARPSPADDLVTTLIEADVDGERAQRRRSSASS